jgi:hypothetical protein
MLTQIMQKKMPVYAGQMTEVYSASSTTHIVVDRKAKRESLFDHCGWGSLSQQQKEALQLIDVTWLQQ